MTKTATPDLTLLVPMYNEEEVLPIFFARIAPVLAGLDVSYEILCVNDGSRDRTLEMLLAQQAEDPHLRILDLSRNFGKEAAMTAGLDAARGRAVIPMDADLQDPPELIADFVTKWREGYDVVYGKRASRQADDPAKRITAGLFYRLYNRLADLDIPPNTGDFRLMDRAVVDALKSLPERNRFMKGLFNWVGFKQIGVEYERPDRAAGQSKWNYWKLWNFALDGITAFSTVPLRVWSYLGLFISSFAFLFGAFIIIKTLITGIDQPGYASIMVVILFLGGVQLISIGILGEYLGRLYIETKNRPIYILRQIHEPAAKKR